MANLMEQRAAQLTPLSDLRLEQGDRIGKMRDIKS